MRKSLRSLGFGGFTDSGILLGIILRIFCSFSELDTLQVYAHLLLLSILSLISWECSGLKETFRDSKLGKWWRQTPYMLSNSNQFMSTFIELIQDRNWKVICDWLALDKSIHQLLLLDRSQQTVLHHAILYRAPAHVIAAILVKAPSLASVQNDLGEVALHWAVRLETNREILNMLLNANPGAGIYSRDHNGITPLWLLWDRTTRSMSTNEIVDMFLTSPASWKSIELLLDPPREHHRSSTRQSSLLHKVASYPTPAGVLAVVHAMFREFEEMRDTLGRTPLMVACSSPTANESYDSETKIQFLLRKCPHTHSIQDNNGRRPLHVALQNGIGFVGKGLEELIQLDRGESLRNVDPLNQLPLFTLPTMGSKESDTDSVDTAFRLLRYDPSQVEVLRSHCMA